MIFGKDQNTYKKIFERYQATKNERDSKVKAFAAIAINIIYTVFYQFYIIFYMYMITLFCLHINFLTISYEVSNY